MDTRGKIMASGLPFDDFRELLAQLPGPDERARERTISSLQGLPNHAGALGRLSEIAAWYAAWSGTDAKPVARPLVAVFAGNHGIAASPDTAFDMAETKRLVESCTDGSAAVNALCAADNLGLRMFDLALEHPTGDIRSEAAFDERGCAATMAFGMEAIAGSVDLAALAGAGAGNEVVAATLLAALLGGEVSDWTDDGAEAEMIAAALETHRGHLGDPLEALRRVGGRELAAIAGTILAARMERIPVVLDGAPALAAAAVLWKANNQAVAHCLLADRCGGVGHARATDVLGLEPLLDCRISTGDGTAAALGISLVGRAAATCIGAAGGRVKA